jgi:hypothetical protein
VEPHDASWSGGVDEAGFQPVAAATMERFLEQVEGKNVPAVLGFAGFKALGRWFELPPMKDSKLSEAVAYEAKMQIPIPIDDIVYDWQSGPPSESSGGQLPVTLLAARRDHLETWAALFQSPAIKPVAIQSTCLALYNAGQYVAGLGEKEAQSEGRCRDFQSGRGLLDSRSLPQPGPGIAKAGTRRGVRPQEGSRRFPRRAPLPGRRSSLPLDHRGGLARD